MRQSGEAQRWTARIFDGQGREVMRQQAFGVQEQLDLSSLTPGLYVVQVEDSGWSQRLLVH